MKPSLVVLGHVTLDLIQREAHAPLQQLGGAAGFCARVAAHQGETVGIVTSAPASLSVLSEIKGNPSINLALHTSQAATTFSLDYRQTPRALRLLAKADQLTGSMIPAAWTATPVAFIGPVANECEPSLAAALPQAFIGVGLQGAMRVFDDQGFVRPAWPDAWLSEWPAAVKVAILSEEDHPDAAAVAQAVAGKGVIVALTRGACGATLFSSAEDGGLSALAVPACPAVQLDPTGAGDTFAVVLTLALAAGRPLPLAAGMAAQAAARVVEGPGLGRL